MPEQNGAAAAAAAFAPEPAFGWSGADAGPEQGGGALSGGPENGASAAAPAPESAPDQGWGTLPPEPSEPELAALRSLIMRREMALLDKIKQRLDDPRLHARDVSSVIAEALLLRAGKDDKLARSLEPVVEGIFKESLRKNPLDFANALFPLMGPAIRRSIAEAFRSMLEGVNKSVEMAFSWKGLRWRMEAWRSGKPFSEIVLLNTLIYRVEQVFLIHRGTGLVLAHEVNEGVEYEDADMVSAMLTAIQDFVNDSFARGAEGDLESLSLGEYTILMEKNSLACLACVVRGQPPADFREKMRSSLELIVVELYEELKVFKGDAAPFSLARRYLSDLMLARFVNENRPLPFWVKTLPVLLLLSLASGIGFWQYREHTLAAGHLAAAQMREQARDSFYREMDEKVNALRREPGIVVFDVHRADAAPWTLLCFRDDFARQVEEVLREAGAAADDFAVNSHTYISLDAQIVRRRVEAALKPPEGAAIAFGEDGVLRFTGSAPISWILSAKQTALTLPGIKGTDTEGISDPRMARIRELISYVESLSIRFALGKDTPTPEDAPKLASAVESLVELENTALEMGMAVNLVIFGHTDALGNPKRNYELSQARASTLAAMLYAKGSTLSVSSYGMGADFADKAAADKAPADKTSADKTGDPDNRRIELKVHITRAGGEEQILR